MHLPRRSRSRPTGSIPLSALRSTSAPLTSRKRPPEPPPVGDNQMVPMLGTFFTSAQVAGPGVASSTGGGVEVVYENQRRFPLKGWTGRLVERPNWSSEDGVTVMPKVKTNPSWKVIIDPQLTDSKGWMYASGFHEKWGNKKTLGASVRRRMWMLVETSSANSTAVVRNTSGTPVPTTESLDSDTESDSETDLLTSPDADFKPHRDRTDAVEPARLLVTVKRADDLQTPKDGHHYVKLRIKGRDRWVRTKICRGGRNPEWNTNFSLPLPEGEGTLEVLVFDTAKGKNTDEVCIGQGFIIIGQIARGISNDISISLVVLDRKTGEFKTPKGRNSRLFLTVQPIGCGKEDTPVSYPRSRSPSNSSSSSSSGASHLRAQQVNGSLKVRVVSLRVKDTQQCNSVNTAVFVNLKTATEQRSTTAKRMHGNAVSWGEEIVLHPTCVLTTRATKVTTEVLRVEVVSEGVETNMLMGTAAVLLSSLPCNQSREQTVLMGDGLKVQVAIQLHAVDFGERHPSTPNLANPSPNRATPSSRSSTPTIPSRPAAYGFHSPPSVISPPQPPITSTTPSAAPSPVACLFPSTPVPVSATPSLPPPPIFSPSTAMVKGALPSKTPPRAPVVLQSLPAAVSPPEPPQTNAPVKPPTPVQTDPGSDLESPLVPVVPLTIPLANFPGETLVSSVTKSDHSLTCSSASSADSSAPPRSYTRAPVARPPLVPPLRLPPKLAQRYPGAKAQLAASSVPPSLPQHAVQEAPPAETVNVAIEAYPQNEAEPDEWQIPEPPATVSSKAASEQDTFTAALPPSPLSSSPRRTQEPDAALEPEKQIPSDAHKVLLRGIPPTPPPTAREPVIPQCRGYAAPSLSEASDTIAAMPSIVPPSPLLSLHCSPPRAGDESRSPRRSSPFQPRHGSPCFATEQSPISEDDDASSLSSVPSASRL
eukprot:TRINITY_DN6131_c0_g1_i1.p1 TRINITY_DN6131_c0_g1~~TRINITY_DN6131_c0_g1_i1.p1  ORF type:complete len:932 (+),score=81.52 TRINITY_DN6131_c0_g1_i1:55-2850(+)